MSVTRTTVEETAQAGGGHREALDEINLYGMVLIRNLRTGSRFTICIIDYQHMPEGKRKRANK